MTLTDLARSIWVTEQSDLADPASLISQLLHELLAGDPEQGGTFVFLSRYYTWIDVPVSAFVAPALAALHERVFSLLYLQSSNWPQAYCNG